MSRAPGCARGLRQSVGRRAATHPLLSLAAFLPGKTDRLVIAPQDLRTADPTRASEIYAGRFAFAGKVVICDGRSPFEMTPPSDEWAATLLGFGWLRHLRAAESAHHPRQCPRAGRRMDHACRARWHRVAWRARRAWRAAIISWLSQAPLILDDADAHFYRRFLRSLTRQVRYLRAHRVSTRATACRACRPRSR